MNTTYAYLTGRRAWFVPAVSIWGELGAETIDALATETDDAATRVVFQRFTIGGMAQDIAFSALTDHRGNSLPDQIDHPVVIPVAKNAVSIAVIGTPGNTSFRVGKGEAAAEDGMADLWIIEAGS
ncbi:MAG: hypothetical protein AB1792_11140 [Candidatus Zixiibacteriota bacterium]